MVKVDLITGFLGAGKTTFIKKYAKHFIDKGEKIGILENDYGAVNVDMLLLNELRGENCELEMVAGGGDADCHKRRFKTKLIAMKMSGYDRVIIEPSGVFDMDEFFDTLRDEPLDEWYEIGSVITVMDATLGNMDTEEEEYIRDSQLSNAGCIVLSKVAMAGLEKVNELIDNIAKISVKMNCRRPLEKLVNSKNWDAYTDEDYELISRSGYQNSSYVKKLDVMKGGFSTLYYLEHGLSKEEIIERINVLKSDTECGKILRVKGFFVEKEGWMEINATRADIKINEIAAGQEVIIVIGYGLDKNRIDEIMKQR